LQAIKGNGDPQRELHTFLQARIHAPASWQGDDPQQFEHADHRPGETLLAARRGRQGLARLSIRHKKARPWPGFADLRSGLSTLR